MQNQKLLKEVALRNFQKHKNLKLELDPITTLVGRNDAGKSAIVRALVYTLTGIPRRNKFQRRGQDWFSVTLTFSGGTVIKRKKSKKENSYYLSGQKLEAFGNIIKVPLPVSNFLKINEYNIQSQIDQPFKMCEKGKAKAEFLNEIINLSILDEAIEIAAKKTRASKGRKKYIEEELKHNRDSLKELAWFSDFSVHWKQVVKLQERQDSIGSSVQNITKLVEQTKEDEIELTRWSEIDALLPELRRREARSSKIEAELTQISAIVNLIQHYTLLAEAEGVETLHECLLKRKRTQEQLFAISNAEVTATEAESRIKKSEIELTKLNTELEESGALCPTCSRPLKTT